MTVPPQAFWSKQTTSCWSTSNVTETHQLTTITKNTPTHTPLAGTKHEVFSSNPIKKQNNNNLIDLNFFDCKENSNKNFVNVRTSVLEAFDPLLHEQSNISSAEVDQGIIV